MENANSPISLSQAVEAIKTAILQGQYEALKDVNRVQLAVYYAIGKYLSKNTRKGVWEPVISINKFGGRNRRIKIVSCD